MTMKEPQTKAELLQYVHDGRVDFLNLINQIPKNRLLEKGVESDWSIKDILAHITAWEVKMSEAFAEIQAGGAPHSWPETDADVDALNAEFYAGNKDKPLAQVLSEFEDAFPQAVAATEALSEEDLFDPDRFAWRKERPLWWMVAGNTYGHYGDHVPNIQAWLGSE